MNTTALKFLRLAVLCVLVVALSGCALGDRARSSRLRAGDNQNQPVDSPALSISGSSSEADNPGESGDAQVEELLNLIDSLAASNQAGDALEDIP